MNSVLREQGIQVRLINVLSRSDYQLSSLTSRFDCSFDVNLSTLEVV